MPEREQKRRRATDPPVEPPAVTPKPEPPAKGRRGFEPLQPAEDQRPSSKQEE